MKTLITTLLAATALTAVSGGAMAADLAVPGPAPVVAAPAASTNWDGPYIGASVGYGWGTASLTDSSGTVTTASPTGFLVGAQLGYNFHLADQIVVGLEGNIDWVGESGDFANNAGYHAKTDWEGSIRARLGYDAGQFLPYIEAGVAFANVGTNWNNKSVDVFATDTGWTVGAGVEFMLADNLSANVEYRYSDYGSDAINSSTSIHLTDSTVRVGLNYHF